MEITHVQQPSFFPILAFVIHQEQPVLPFLGWDGIGQYILDGPGPAFVDASQGFFHHAADPTSKISSADQMVPILRQAEIQPSPEHIFDFVDCIVDFLCHLSVHRPFC